MSLWLALLPCGSEFSRRVMKLSPCATARMPENTEKRESSEVGTFIASLKNLIAHRGGFLCSEIGGQDAATR